MQNFFYVSFDGPDIRGNGFSTQGCDAQLRLILLKSEKMFADIIVACYIWIGRAAAHILSDGYVTKRRPGGSKHEKEASTKGERRPSNKTSIKQCGKHHSCSHILHAGWSQRAASRTDLICCPRCILLLVVVRLLFAIITATMSATLTVISPKAWREQPLLHIFLMLILLTLLFCLGRPQARDRCTRLRPQFWCRVRLWRATSRS